MMDADERDVPGKADRLGGGYTGQERPHKAGAVGHGDGVDILQGLSRRGQGLADDLVDALYVLARCDLGDLTAVEGVNVYL
jgi:hypothetical protein